jgi:CheY-like chemotaxis protein
MDGFETIMAFRRTAPSMPIIAMSGAMTRYESSPAPPDYLQMATAFGALHRLQKPFRPHELLQTVQKSLSTGRKSKGSAVQ